jgi:hypothetical protein
MLDERQAHPWALAGEQDSMLVVGYEIRLLTNGDWQLERQEAFLSSAAGPIRSP